MTYGIQCFDANGRLVVDTNFLTLSRIIYTESFASEAINLGATNYDRTPAGFNASLPGHYAFLVPNDNTVPYPNNPMLTYPTNSTIRLSRRANTTMNCKLLVFTS